MNIWKILAVGGGIMVLGFWVSPQWEQVKLLQADLVDLGKLKTEKTAAVKALGTSVGTGADEVLQQIPYTPQQATLINDLRLISAKTGFVFRTLGFGKGENATVDAAQITVNFSVLGQKTKVVDFLKLIESNRRFIGMDNLSVSIQKKNEVELAELNVTLYAFSQQN